MLKATESPSEFSRARWPMIKNCLDQPNHVFFSVTSLCSVHPTTLGLKAPLWLFWVLLMAPYEPSP